MRPLYLRLTATLAFTMLLASCDVWSTSLDLDPNGYNVGVSLGSGGSWGIPIWNSPVWNTPPPAPIRPGGNWSPVLRPLPANRPTILPAAPQPPVNNRPPVNVQPPVNNQPPVNVQPPVNPGQRPGANLQPGSGMQFRPATLPSRPGAR